MTLGIRVVSTRSSREVEASIDAAVRNILAENAPDVLLALQKAAPKESGDLADGMFIESVGTFGKAKYFVRVKSRTPYFNAVIFGHGEINIAPTEKKALAFLFPAGQLNPRSVDGRTILKRVTVPARKGNNFVKATIREILPKLTGKMATDFVTLIRR